MLLEDRELPEGDWLVLAEMSWRAGTVAWFSSESRRARRAGGFTAFRSFQDITAPKWLQVSVSPSASSTDAAALVPKLLSRASPNPQSISTVTKERKVEDQSLTGVPDAWIYEQLTTSRDGPGVVRYVAGSVENIVFGVSWSRFGEDWSWDDILLAATAQSMKIRHAIGGSY